MKIVCVIPARGGSKRLPKKNIYPFLGKPLISWSIDECLKSDFLNNQNIYVSSEDKSIKEVVKKHNIRFIDRPKELAKDHVWTQDVLSHAKDYLNKQSIYFDIMVRIQANSPQIKAEMIDKCIEKLINYDLWEVFSVNKNGIEDAAIHVLLDKCINQKALSVYKGVVYTNYTDVHTIEDLKRIESESK